MEYSNDRLQLILIHMLLKFHLTDAFLSFYFMSWQQLLENGTMYSSAGEINVMFFYLILD